MTEEDHREIEWNREGGTKMQLLFLKQATERISTNYLRIVALVLNIESRNYLHTQRFYFARSYYFLFIRFRHWSTSVLHIFRVQCLSAFMSLMQHRTNYLCDYQLVRSPGKFFKLSGNNNWLQLNDFSLIKISQKIKNSTLYVLGKMGDTLNFLLINDLSD